LTTNSNFASWGEVLEDVLAAAILDHLLGNALVINIRRDSSRMRKNTQFVDE
jgi:DNA replication protein DnaC